MSYQRLSYVNGMCSSPFFDDLKFNEWISDKGVNNSER